MWINKFSTLLEQVQTYCLKSSTTWYTNPPNTGFIPEASLQENATDTFDRKIIIWLLRLERYFLASAQSRNGTAFVIKGFFSHLHTIQEDIAPQFYADPKILDCLILSLAITHDQGTWDNVLPLIRQHSVPQVQLILLQWMYNYYFKSEQDSDCEAVLLQLKALGEPFEESVLKKLFSFVALSRWYIQHPEHPPESSPLNIIIPENPGPLPMMMFLATSSIRVRFNSRNHPKLTQLTTALISKFLSSFRESTINLALAHCKYTLNITASQLIPEVFKRFDEFSDIQQLIGLAHLFILHSPKSMNFLDVNQNAGQSLVRKLFSHGEYFDAYRMYDDLITAQTLRVTDPSKFIEQAMFLCFMGVINNWLKGSESKPEFTERQEELLPSLAKHNDYKKSFSQYPKTHFVTLLRRLGQRYQTTVDDAQKELCVTYYGLVKQLLTKSEQKALDPLFAKKPTPVPVPVASTENIRTSVLTIPAIKEAPVSSEPPKVEPKPEAVATPSQASQAAKRGKQKPIKAAPKQTEPKPKQPAETPAPIVKPEASPAEVKEVVVRPKQVQKKPKAAAVDLDSDSDFTVVKSKRKQEKPPAAPKEPEPVQSPVEAFPSVIFRRSTPRSASASTSSHKNDRFMSRSSVSNAPAAKRGIDVKELMKGRDAVSKEVHRKALEAVTSAMKKGSASRKKKQKKLIPVSKWPTPETASQPLDNNVWPKLGEQVPETITHSPLFFGVVSSAAAVVSNVIELPPKPVKPRAQAVKRESIPANVMQLVDELRVHLASAELYLTGAAPSNIMDGVKPNDYDILVVNSTLPLILEFLKSKGLKPEQRSKSNPILYCPLVEGISLDFTAKSTKDNETVQDVLQADFALRDFNVNAIYCQFTAADEFPIFSFKSALTTRNQKVIETIGDAKESLTADPTRLIRLLKLIITHPEYAMGSQLQQTLDEMKGQWLVLFKQFNAARNGNIDRLNHAFRKLFMRQKVSDINKILNKFGVLEELTGLSLEDALSAGEKIVSNRPENKFLYWIIANMLHTAQSKPGEDSPISGILSLTLLERDIMNFVTAKTSGREPDVHLYLQDLLSMVKAFDIPQSANNCTM